MKNFKSTPLKRILERYEDFLEEKLSYEE